MIPCYIYNKGITPSNNHAIADKFNEYFPEVEPELAKSIFPIPTTLIQVLTLI